MGVGVPGHFNLAVTQPAAASNLSVVEHLNGFEGKSIEQRAIERMAEYDDKGVVLSFENAVEEITADACTQMLQDSKAMEQLAAENKSLFQKITDFLKELFVDIKKAFKGAYLGNEAKAMQQHMDELQKIWDKALVGAVKQHNNYELVQKNKGQAKYSLMNNKTLDENIKEIVHMSDEEALKRKQTETYLEVLSNTPEVILNNVSDAKDIKVIIRFDAAYLATRHSGILDGHYHNYGENFSKQLLSVLNNPNAILRLKNGRLNLFGTIKTEKGNDSIVSVELNTVKDIDSKYKAYNLIVSMIPAKSNYINNLIAKQGERLEYEKEDLSQVNPQLHKSLSIVNDKSSNINVPQNGTDVNTYFMQEDGKNSLRRAENSYEALGELEKLKKRNAALEKDIKGLNKALKLTKQLTHGKLVSPAQVRMVAEIIRKNAGSSYSSQKLAPRLEEVYNWLAAGKDVSYEAFYEKAVGIATDLAEDIRPAKVEIPYYKELTKAIRDCKIALSEQQKSEVAEIYGSYNEFRKQNMGKFTLTDKGTLLDVAWQELSKKYPGAFEQDLTEPDQPLQLSEIYDAARSCA